MTDSPSTDILTLDRFRALADAYGGAVARWPEDVRAAAMRLSARPDAAAILRDAAAFDTVLDAWRVPSPAAALRDRIVARAPGPAGSVVARARLWWSGIGIAAALAGAVAGTAAVAVATPFDAASDSATSFGDVAAAES